MHQPGDEMTTSGIMALFGIGMIAIMACAEAANAGLQQARQF
jgi:hypothetical protein